MKRKIYFILTLIYSIINLVICFNSTIIPNKFIIPLIITYTLSLLIIYILTTRKKILLNIFGIILSIIIITINTTIILANNEANNLLNKITNTNKITYNYSLIVLNDSSYNNIKELNDKTIGTYYNDTDINYNKALTKLNDKLTYKEQNQDNIIDTINSLYKKEVEGIFIATSYIDIIKESDKTFENKTKIIDTISIKVKSKEKVKTTNKGEPFILYISGIDTYGEISSVSRSDVNIIATINPKTGKVLLTHIPRDYYVQLRDTTGYKDKLTHAGVYGINKSINTIEDLLDIKIDYYMRINFNSLISLIDKIGGIDVYSEISFTPHTNKKVYINQGMNHLNGEQALAFSRERYAYIEGDRHRGQNQEIVIEAIIKKLTTSNDIKTFKILLNELDKILQTNMDTATINNLINNQIDNNTTWSVESYNLNGFDASEYTYSYPNQKLYVMIPDETTVQEAKNKINETKNMQ